jgi:hypothetical protein
MLCGTPGIKKRCRPFTLPLWWLLLLPLLPPRPPLLLLLLCSAAATSAAAAAYVASAASAAGAPCCWCIITAAAWCKPSRAPHHRQLTLLLKDVGVHHQHKAHVTQHYNVRTPAHKHLRQL